MAGKKRSISLNADIHANQTEWDEALCPICMEHPHNAVLILCSSHANGCRYFVCDTSYRHSNCLDRFKKLKKDFTSPASPPHINLLDSNDSSSPQLTLSRWSQDSGEYVLQHDAVQRENHASLRDQSELSAKTSLKCPLCRGAVLGWTVVPEARRFLNLKYRSCTRDSCSFVGNYHELRKHARSVHPRVRPAEVDPSRERAWRSFEHQREHDDAVSAIRSAMPGALVLGDFVIENSDSLAVERERTSGGAANGPLNTLFFVRMFESLQSLAGPRNRAGSRTRHRNLSGGSSRGRYLWGENLLGIQDDEEDDDNFTDEAEMNLVADVSEQDTSFVRRQRRRLTRTRSSREGL